MDRSVTVMVAGEVPLGNGTLSSCRFEPALCEKKSRPSAYATSSYDDLVFAVALAHCGAKKIGGLWVSGDDGIWKYEGELGGWRR